MIAYSILDLATVYQNQTPRDAFLRSKVLAQQAEKEGYTRFWVAEHHNMVNIASSATTVLMGYLAENTNSIRIGSGGVMMPNHAPLMVAESFGTLESLYPGRIDCGLGRAPGTDQKTTFALRRDPHRALEFPDEVRELQSYFNPAMSTAYDPSIQAIPGRDLDIPIYILGSSLFSAGLAAELGLPYVFAAHFAPDHLIQAIETYRRKFKPSNALESPYVIVCMNAIVAESDREAHRLFTTMEQSFTNLVRGTIKLSPPPVDDIESEWNIVEKVHVNRMLRYSAVGGEENVRLKLKDVLRQTKADELMFTSAIFDETAHLDSYRRLAEIMQAL